MELRTPNFSKLKDIFKRNLFLFCAILILVPLTLVSHYVYSPNDFKMTFRIKISSLALSQSDNPDLTGELQKITSDPTLFERKEIEYLKKYLNVDEVLGKTTLKISLGGRSEGKLYDLTNKLVETFQKKIGTLATADFLNEKKRVEDVINRDTQEKAPLEDYIKTLDELGLQTKKNALDKQSAYLNNEIYNKTQQLKLVNAKIPELEINRDSNLSLFKSKGKNLTAEIDSLNWQKQIAEEQLSETTKSLEGVKRTIEIIVQMEKSIEENSNKLTALNSIQISQNQDYVKIPYLTNVQILDSQIQPIKVFKKSSLNQRLIISILLSILAVILITIYYLSINPVISSIDELEKLVKAPVIGAIYEVKKK